MRNIWLFPQLLLWANLHLSRSETTVPAPIDIGSSQTWDGDDGKWSSFPLRVGTPAQNVRVLISTSSTNTWVIDDPRGCQGFPLPDCEKSRGQLFAYKESTSWQDISGPNSGFDTVSESYLGFNVQAQAGFDTVGLGFQGSGGPTVDHSVIGLINSQNFTVGRVGLNFRRTNFSSFNDGQISFLDQLWHDNAIPSLSYSYSAGAYYRSKPGSLTLGGYNEGLFAPNDVSFPFNFDQQFDLTLGLQAITSQVNRKNTSLLPEGIMTFIDSTVTQLWLPEDACKRFEDTFGIKYDNWTNLYFFNETQHAVLAKQSPNITFTLGAATTGGPTVDITFPYAAFDLNISYPTVTNSTYYFPLRKATNSTQYTLGRVFFQEAYLTVDNERSTFNVSQRTWDPNPQSRIVAITSTSNATTTSSTPGSTSSDTNKSTDKKKGGISTGAIVAIIIVIIALLAIGAGIFLYIRLRKRKLAQREAMVAAAAATAASEEQDNKDALSPQQNGVTELYSPPIKPPELQGNYFSGHEAPGSDVERRGELEGDEAHRRAEMATEARRAEMDAATVYYELEAPHGMHEMSTLRGMRRDQRWGETTSPVSSPISRKSVPSPISPQSPPKDR